MKKLFILISVLTIILTTCFYACEKTVPNENSSTVKAEKGDDRKAENITDNGVPNDITPYNGVLTYLENDGKITVTGVNSATETEIVIPSRINGLPVTEIRENAFENRKTLQSLVVPKSVEKIGYGILSGCAGLTSLTLPFTGDGNKTGRGANDYNFGYIFGKTSYGGATSTMQFYHRTTSDDVEMNYYYIPDALKEVTITGTGETHIPYGAFYNCSAIKKITLCGGIKSIGEFAFSGVTAKINWNNPTIKTIGEHAFEDFKGTALEIPDGVTKIQKKGYSACVNVKEFTLPESVKDIDIYAFSYCYDLEKITFGNNVKKLSAETFYFCTGLKSVSMPENLEIIEDGAFDSCKSLAEIEIPTSVVRINADAFKTCLKLKTVRFDNADGWRYFSTETSGDDLPETALKNASTAAKYLTETFRDYIWERTPR